MSFVCCYICHHRLRSSGDLYRDDSSTGSSYHSRFASNGSSKSSAGQCRRRQRACYVSRRERFVGTTSSSPRTSNSAAFMCLAVVVLALLGTHGVSGFACHPKCTCIWRGGKQTATCSNLSLTKVPAELDSDIQVLDLRMNQIAYLPRQVFVDAGLTNLQKLFLAECGMSQVDETAFARLSNLIELDLSLNYLPMVPSPSFRHLTNLRILSLVGNKITFLGQQAFSDLKKLISLDISSCMIDSVAMGAFDGLEKLEKLRIDGNRLGSLSGKAVLPLKSLNAINLDNNPWRCDCDLRALRHWLHLRNIPYVSPTCDKPPRLSGRSWTHLTPEEFACPPAFLNTSSAFQVFEGSNVTLECKTTGDPLPTISWYWRDRVLGNLSEGISPRQIFTVVERSEREKYSALTVSYVQEANNGPYTCKAENVAAKVAKNFTVHVSRKPVTEVKVTGSGGNPGGSNQDDNPQEVRELDAGGVSGGDGSDGNKDTLIGLIVGVVGGALLVLIIFAVVLLVCRRRRRDRRQRAEASAAGGPLNKLAPMDKVPDCIDEADTKLLSPRPQNVSVLPPAYLHQHEMEPLEPLMERNSLSPHVWVVKDHVPPEWPPRRSPIPVPMPVAPTSNDPEVNARLHNELADTLRRKGDRRVINERERGDGISEMESAEDPDGLKVPPGHYGTLRGRDLQDRSSGDEPDLLLLERPKRAQILPSVMEHPHPQYQASTLDRRHASPAPGHARQEWGDGYDHPSAYFRPVQSAPVANPILHVPVLQTVKDADDGGGSDGTEV